MQEGCLGSHKHQLMCWRDISVARGLPLGSVGSKPQAGWTETQITSMYEKQQGFCLQGRDGWRHREPLKGPKHKISLLTLCASKGRAEWTRDIWGESEAGGSVERTEGTRTSTRIHVLSHSPYCKSHYSEAEHSSLKGISPRGINPPAHRNYCTPPCGA